MRELTVGLIQCSLSDSLRENTEKISAYVAMAAERGAQVILPSELFGGHYFCKEKDRKHFERAVPFEGNALIQHFSRLAAELHVVLPISFFERDGDAFYNSLAMIDADGSILGRYRKSHIPDGPGYDEKFYFTPGDTGFRVWNTRFARLGVGICWDQWFPECARAMVLAGAEVLLYPTAIGSEPHNPSLDTKDRWQRVMIGHAVANVIPVIAANRTGIEGNQTFYGSSFIADDAGDKIAELGRTDEGVLVTALDLDRIERARTAWGLLADRRPDLYQSLAK